MAAARATVAAWVAHDQPYPEAAAVADLADALRRANVDAAALVLVGHSLGCLTALGVAARLADAGRAPGAVVLVSPAWLTPEQWERRHGAGALRSWVSVLLRVARAVPRAALRWTLAHVGACLVQAWFRGRARRHAAFDASDLAPADAAAWAAGTVDALHSPGFAAAAGGGATSLRRLRARGVRVVVVHGDRDGVLVAPDPAMVSVWLRGGGHCLPRTHPDALWRAVHDALSPHVAATRRR